MEYVSVEELLARRAESTTGMPEKDVTLAGLGKVRVRSLSRAEALASKDVDERRDFEAFIIACGMVQPPMTQEQARAWLNVATPYEIEQVTDEIGTLSGVTQDAVRTAVREQLEDSDAGFRDVPRGEAAHDGGEVASGDEQ